MLWANMLLFLIFLKFHSQSGPPANNFNLIPTKLIQWRQCVFQCNMPSIFMWCLFRVFAKRSHRKWYDVRTYSIQGTCTRTQSDYLCWHYYFKSPHLNLVDLFLLTFRHQIMQHAPGFRKSEFVQLELGRIWWCDASDAKKYIFYIYVRLQMLCFVLWACVHSLELSLTMKK